MGLTDAAVQRGESVEFRPCGHSMEPLIRHRQKVRVSPLMRDPVVGDVVLAFVRGHLLLHRVNARRGDQYQIANQRGHVDGWCTRKQIYGIAPVVGGSRYQSIALANRAPSARLASLA